MFWLGIVQRSPETKSLVEKLFCLVYGRDDVGRQIASPVGKKCIATKLLSGMEKYGFGAELEADGNRPGIAAFFVSSGEQLCLASFFVGRDANVESNCDIGKRIIRIASQQIPPRPFKQ